jgi:hypothetical protein
MDDKKLKILIHKIFTFIISFIHKIKIILIINLNKHSKLKCFVIKCINFYYRSQFIVEEAKIFTVFKQINPKKISQDINKLSYAPIYYRLKREISLARKKG